MTATGTGGPDGTLTPEQVTAYVRDALGADDYAGRSVCVLVPDATRSCPLPLLLDAVHAALTGRVTRLSVVVALGTHAPMSEAALAALVGCEPGRIADRYPGMTVRNHEWWDPARLTTVGRLDEATVERLSGGRLRRAVDVTVNRAVVDHDTVLVVGPVFPHEVVGFSGGNKYLFPGIAGQEVIDLSHWLGALIGSAEIIGTRGPTPVRAVIDAAAAQVPARRRALCVVVASGGDALHSVAYGEPEESWALAADVAAEAHVRHLDAPVGRVLSIIPDRYDEMWTAAKGMYKVEPVVADGGEVVIYAPHVRTVSHTHDAQIRAIGYHCREFFTARWDRFRDLPWGVLAHSTHLRGAGSYDPDHGERCRVTVTLATGIDEATTRALGLSYRDPAGIDPAAWAADPDTLVVPNAGEVLFRLR
ncbi:MAG TPA: lactate racemase domain-containing protein [Actinocatenispora sp.]